MEQQKENAFNLINQVCSKYVGDLSDHQKIQHALAVIKESLNEEPKKEENEE